MACSSSNTCPRTRHQMPLGCEVWLCQGSHSSTHLPLQAAAKARTLLLAQICGKDGSMLTVALIRAQNRAELVPCPRTRTWSQSFVLCGSSVPAAVRAASSYSSGAFFELYVRLALVWWEMAPLSLSQSYVECDIKYFLMIFSSLAFFSPVFLLFLSAFCPFSPLISSGSEHCNVQIVRIIQLENIETVCASFGWVFNSMDIASNFYV